MSHIHTAPGQHDATVSAFIIRIDTEPLVLLHKHKKLGILGQIGGHVELHENPWQAMQHEIKEESGYDITDLMILQPKPIIHDLRGGRLHPYPLVHNTHNFSKEHFHSDISYAFVTDVLPQSSIAEGESDSLTWLNRNDLLKIDDQLIFPDIKDIYCFMLDECLDKWHRVSSDSYS